ncbi:amidohydrolase [Rhizobiaceae bacterium BDR2-2]|uniref:Amidohydrolase n=1 Tax=Ectorhizobium quercum TaxID=2965071 RepID=A0AAE3MY56_9HYPH|nr:amidohydrolase [Ectorhizobium quercum]MCX8996436.1 amidohydrolase [Ectorhizobium quercum]
MPLTAPTLMEVTRWRRKLHARPDISGEEHETAREVVDFLSPTRPDRVITGLGGTGVAVIYQGTEPGPTVAIRAELDALPIFETGTPPWRSTVAGKGHMCGHDGHMAILAAVGHALGNRRPRRGRAVLLFQPAEETGAGAAAMIGDGQFADARPDVTLSLHNMPGLPFGHVWLKEGTANCASQGLRIVLTGRTAHASLPHTGLSPAPAIADLVPALTALGGGSLETGDLTLATVTHVRIGEPTFGIAPGEGEIRVTLRTQTDAAMAAVRAAAEDCARAAAQRDGLTVLFEEHDVFRAAVNHPQAVALLRNALDAEGVPHSEGEAMRASEDFGRFADISASAMFFLGAGETHPAPHSPDYDFPDDLIPIGARIFLRAIHDLLD